MATRIFATSLLMDAAFFCAWAAVPFLVRSEASPALYLDDAQLGMLRALSSLMYISGSFGLSGRWVRLNRAGVARTAAVLTGIFMVAASFARSRLALCALLPVSTLALSAFWPNLMALVGETPGKPLVKRIASFNCWWSVGKAAAFLAAGSLLQLTDDPPLVLRFAGVAMALLALLIPESGARGEAAGQAPASEEPGRERFFLAGLFGIYAGWLVGGTFETHFPEGFGRVWFGQSFGGEYKFWCNALLFGLFAGQALGFFVLRWWTGWPMRGRWLAGAILLIPLSQILLRLTDSPYLWAPLLVATGMASAMSYGQSLYHAQAGRSDKVRRSGIHEGTLSLGSLTGSLGVGFLMRGTGDPKSALIMTAVLSGLCAVAAMFAVRRR